MRRRIDWFRQLLRVGALLVPWIDAGAGEPEPEETRLRAHVVTLASPEYLGRRGAGGRKAADYLIAEFRRLGLDPLFAGSFEQDIPGKGGEPPLGRNVGATLRGTDPKLRDDWVVVSAHYDHLGRRGGVTYPGADDNASGVAMMLEVARSFVEGGERPRRSVMFIGFDLEEVGLFGSRYFVEHAPIPLNKIALFVTADMIGRSLGGVCTPYVFVMGTEYAPGLRPWIARAAQDGPVRVGLLGSDLLLLDRSDYGPFRSRKIPFLFFSTGENPVYHTPRDLAETLDYPKLTAISRVINRVGRRASISEQVPTWSTTPDHSLKEAETLRDVMRTLLRNQTELKIGPTQARLMTNTLRALDEILARGTMSADERAGVVRVTRIILLTLF
ncbi:MAG: M20/M25/M40 family metallo-hydrolase [Planctomycetia bacterium]|nr:M20/M25/M40 family metallo-hydrolase [Planctomycetia bacterium]